MSPRAQHVITMAVSSAAPGLQIGELEAGFPLYCKALRMLVRGGASLSTVQRTVCWEHLMRLHLSLPRQYRDPEMLYRRLRREWWDPSTEAAAPKAATPKAVALEAATTPVLTSGDQAG